MLTAIARSSRLVGGRQLPLVLSRALSGTQSTYTIATAGPDRYGIVAAASNEISNVGGNITDSRSFKLRGTFVMALLVEVPCPSKNLSKLQNMLESSAALSGHTVQIDQASEQEAAAPKFKARFEVSLADHPGIVSRVTSLMVPLGLSVTELNTSQELAPHTGSPLFSMTGCLMSADAVDEDALEEAFAMLEREEGIHVTYEKKEIRKEMRRGGF